MNFGFEHAIEWTGSALGVVGAYLLAENRPSSRYAWPIWIGSNLSLIAYFVLIHSWGVLAMQGFYLHSSVRGFRRAFQRCDVTDSHAGSAVTSQSIERAAPFENPGQCIGEGACHHPSDHRLTSTQKCNLSGEEVKALGETGTQIMDEMRTGDGRIGATAAQIDEYARVTGLIPYRGERQWSCQCGSTEDVFVRPAYSDPKHIEYALCRACLTRTVCCVTIGNVDVAPAPDMPSHLFPGCGSDGAEFTVTHGRKPSREEVSDMLYEEVVDAVVVEYDEATGKGYFRVVDGEAPPVGAVVPLIARAETDLSFG